MTQTDALIATRFPREWARANDPRLPNRSKARNNLRRRYRETIEAEAWRAANPAAKCMDCRHCSSHSHVLNGKPTCDVGSDFHGYQVVKPDDWCTHFAGRGGEK